MRLFVHHKKLQDALIDTVVNAVETHMCVDIRCLGCCAIHYRQKLLVAMDIPHLKSPSNNGRPFPLQVMEGKSPPGLEQRVMTVCDQWLDVLWDNEKFDGQVHSRLFSTRLKKFAADMQLNFSSFPEDHGFWQFIKSVAPSHHLYKSQLTSLNSADWRERARDAKWIILSGIEEISGKLDPKNGEFLVDRLRRYQDTNSDVGWRYGYVRYRSHSEPARHNPAGGISNANNDRREAKRVFLKAFSKLSSLEKLKKIAEEGFPYKLEFIPVEMMPDICSHTSIGGYFSADERQRLLDWIGQKSGPWSLIRTALCRPFVIYRRERGLPEA
jgi:hypothetical protein